MNNIQIINQGNELYIDSRNVASGFDIEHEHLLRNMRKHFSGLKTEEGKSEAGRRIVYCLLTEEQVMIIPAICRPTDKTITFQKALVKAFIDARRQLQVKAPMTYLEALQSCVRLEEKRLALEKQIAEDAPKVAFHDTVVSSNDNITVAQFSKALGIGSVTFFRWLRENKILISHADRYNTPYQQFITQGYFTVDESTYDMSGQAKLHFQTKITPKGQTWLSKQWRELI